MIDLCSATQITDRRARSIVTGGSAIVYARVEGTEHVLLSDDFHTDASRIMHAHLVSHSDRQRMIDLAMESGVISLRIEIGEMGESHPMSKCYYESLPRATIVEGSAQSSDMCVICRNRFEAGDIVANLLCKHSFCECCLHKWSLDHSSCPMCRSTLPMESVYHETMRIEKWRTDPYRFKLDWVYLRMQSVKVLRSIMQILCIPKGYCIEKEDLIDAIVGSCNVEIIAPHTVTDSDGTNVGIDQKYLPSTVSVFPPIASTDQGYSSTVSVSPPIASIIVPLSHMR